MSNHVKEEEQQNNFKDEENAKLNKWGASRWVQIFRKKHKKRKYDEHTYWYNNKPKKERTLIKMIC